MIVFPPFHVLPSPLLNTLAPPRERLGPDVADEMEQEARDVGPSLEDDCFLFVARHAS